MSAVFAGLSQSDLQGLYDHLGTIPFIRGSWSNNWRTALSEALHQSSRDSTVVSFACDRCDKPAKGLISNIGTAGFYDVRLGGIWEDMRRGDETFVCDDCVLGSVEYAARSRRLVASHRDNGIEFVWRDGELIGPQDDEGYGDAVTARALDALGYGEVRETPGPPAADRLPKLKPDGGNIHG